MFIKSLVTLILILSTLACVAITKDEADEILAESTIAMSKREFIKANTLVDDLLKHKKNLTYSQNVNALHRLLELSYILKEYERSNNYARELIDLLGENDKYQKYKKRILYRLCESSDWEGGRNYFTDICEQ